MLSDPWAAGWWCTSPSVLSFPSRIHKAALPPLTLTHRSAKIAASLNGRSQPAANTVWKAIGDFILRTWESGTSTLVLVAVGVFAAGVLHRADVVKAALLADGHNVWAEVVEPAAWAALLAVSCATLKAVYGGLPAILPKTKLRSMSADASELASRIEDGLYDDRSQWLLVDLLTFRARLAKLGIHAPKVSGDAAGRDAWVRFLIELRIWIRLGDLRSARAYRPPPT